MQLARDAGALLILRADHLRGELALARAVLRETIEQRVEGGANAHHVAVGEDARFDTRFHVPRGETRCGGLQSSERTQRGVHEGKIHDQAGTERHAEHRLDGAGYVQAARDGQTDQHGDGDEQIAARDLGEKRNAKDAVDEGSHEHCRKGNSRASSPSVINRATPRPSNDPITFPVPE